MENKSNIRKLADARVVQAVRRLKSTRQKNDQIEVRKNQEDIKHPTLINGKQGYIINNNQGSLEFDANDFFLRDVTDDGNFGYRALSLQLYSTEENHALVRKDI